MHQKTQSKDFFEIATSVFHTKMPNKLTWIFYNFLSQKFTKKKTTGIYLVEPFLDI